MAGFSAGQATEKVTIQKPTWTLGVPSWSPLATVYAQVQPAQGAEGIAGEKTTATNRYLVTIWYRGDVTTLMRVLWTPYKAAQRTLDVASVVPQANRQTVVLECVEAQ